MKDEVQVAVLGGGVTGLCAMHYLARELGRDAALILEAADRVGGTSQTDSVDGYHCDWGPNGFLDREPKTLEWIADLGLDTELVRADKAAAHRFVLKGDDLVEAVGPPKFFFSPMLSVKGRMRMCLEPLIPGKKDDEDESIWSFAARRIGREAADTMVMPMVSGVFGGDARRLSLAHCFPRMAAMETDYGSLTRALLAKKRVNKSASPVGPAGVLTSFPEGIGYLPRKVAELYLDRIRTRCSVARVAKRGASFVVECESGDIVEAQSVVVAMPSYVAAGVTAELDAEASRALGTIPYADLAVVCTGYDSDAVGRDPDGFGFLVPPNQGKRLLGSLWTSSIFPQQAPAGHVLLRTMFGGYMDPEAARLSDNELLEHVRRELYPIMRIANEPEMVRIFRHINGIPQYLIGHGRLLDAIYGAEKRVPGLVFAGNAYRGVSLNDCVLSALAAVRKVCALL